MEEVLSVEEVPMTQKWGGECHGSWWTFRGKNCSSEAKLSKSAQSGTL